MITTTAELLLDLLAARGVDTVFGLPGNHTVALYRGFPTRGIRHVTARHEQGAAFMADGYARATGAPGVCVLISGPGLLNAATAIAQAAADSVPMLIVTGVAPLSELGMGRGTLHELPDQHATAASFCRISRTLFTPDNLPALIDEAFACFTAGRPGPVHIEIPLNLMDAPLSVPENAGQAHIAPPGPDPEAVGRAARLLAGAERPLMLLGGGARAASEPLLRLAERLDAPVLNTVNGKGVIPAGHPLAVGGSPSLPSLRAALTEADGVLAVGTELGETDCDLLMQGPLAAPACLIRLDIDWRALTRPWPAAIGITSDAATGARALVDALEKAALTAAASEPPGRRGARRAAALRAAIRADTHFHPEMREFFAALEHAAPDAVIVGDSTRPTYYAAWQLERAAPRRYFHSASGFGTLGYALPAALGAALAVAGGCAGQARGVIALIGDGGIQFTLPELSTATELALPLAVVVWHNDGYREIENSMRARGIAADATRIRAPDFAAAARAHGAAWARPTTLPELEKAVRIALETEGPTLIEVREAEFLSNPGGDWYS